MISISSNYGFILVFRDEKDLEVTITNLQAQLEWARTEGIKPPYLYCTYAEQLSPEEIREYLHKLKETIIVR